MILRRAFLFLLTLILPYAGWAQGFTVIGIPRTQSQKKNIHQAARTQDALILPFWDDFSDTKTGYVNPDLWLYGQSVLVSDGMAINPPSLGVATFDGLDSLGKPYNVTDILAKGYADKLVSASIDLTTIDKADRDSVYLSFQYEMEGNGELPDEGDRLLLSFLDSLDEWVPIDTIDNDGVILPDVFYTSIVPVNNPRFYHPDFKFMIKNFGRLSGPYDAWHVDYVYLNKGRTAAEVSVPDRAISTPMTSLFGVYRSIPIDHFLLREDSILTYPKVVITDLRADQTAANGGQPITLVTTAHITYRDNKVITKAPVFGPHKASSGGDVHYGEFKEYVVDSLPDLNFASTVDSLAIELAIAANTSDNVIKSDTAGDYIPRKYAPIDFRVNDTTKATFILSNEYAYDDGTAEYGAGVNQPGSQVAYEYNLVGVSQENITFLEMYFPRFGDESSQVIEIRIWDDFNLDPIYTEVTSLTRSEQNKFWLKQLTQPVPVKKKFYIGWKQSSSAVIAVGLDKSSDTFDKMHYSVDGTWSTNDLVHGNLMMRPIFGEAAGIDPLGLEDEKEFVVYPNPNNGVFYLQGVADGVVVYDLAGRMIPYTKESTDTETVITLTNVAPGIYVIKTQVNGAVRTAKVMIR